MNDESLGRRFDYHKPSSEHIIRMHEIVREMHRQLAKFIDESIVESREKSLALTKIEESMFWSNAAVARLMNYQGKFASESEPTTTSTAATVTYTNGPNASVKMPFNDYKSAADGVKTRVCPECGHVSRVRGDKHKHD